MPKILVLPDHIASQIAAGEVVERPASVVKELVENSIDAGATRIEISLNADCRDIRVADNGCGMSPDDAVLAFHRHATSKLASVDDLWQLKTMGFRGEALPSISSVAAVSCFTRTSAAAFGTKVVVADGKATSVETGCAPGTIIEVADLFYNVPARLKFLKKASTEFAHVLETVQALSIAFPGIAFQLLNNGNIVFKTSGSGKLSQTLTEAGFFSGEENLCSVSYSEPKTGIEVRGYVARPTHFRGDRKGILSIVNNRPVRCFLTYKALDYAFQDLIPKGKYPLATLVVALSSQQVDVNVHPTKKEIKYTNSNDIYLAMQRAVVDAIRQLPDETSSGLLTKFTLPSTSALTNAQIYSTDWQNAVVRETAVGESNTYRPVSAVKTQQIKFNDHLNYVPPPRVSLPSANELLSPDEFDSAIPADWQLLGYLHNTYILLQTAEGLEIVEQHIAHERTIYERLLAAQKTPGRLSQNSQHLIISAPLNLTHSQKMLIKNNLEKLQALGFDFEFPDESTVLCTQVPLELAHKDYAPVVQSIVESLSETDSAEINLEATKSVACQAAIKNGMALSTNDIYQLLGDWVQTPRNDTCPHGRPIRLKFSLEKLFQMFHPA